MPLEDKNNRIKGIISIILSAAGFAGMAFFVKLSGDVPVMEKAMFRNVVAAVVAFLIMRKEGVSFHIEKKNRLSLFLRCLFGTTGLLCNFWAIGYLKLGDASILQKMAPFFAILMSVFILKEKPGPVAIISVLIALLGATFVVKPFCILQFTVLAAGQFLFLLGAGLCAAIGQIFVTKAYSYAPAKEISVYDYSQVIFSAALGFSFLGEIPDIYSLVGYILIFAMAIWKWKKG